MGVLCQTEGPFGERKIEDYIDHLAKKGMSYLSLQTYQRVLWQFYTFLPGDKPLDEDMLLRWETDLKSRGYADATIQAQRSIISGFMEYVLRRNESQGENAVLHRSVLTREDYLWLLRTARKNGRKRAYLLIKTLVSTGIRSSELKELKVESLRSRGAWVTSHGIRRRVLIPEPIRTGLLEYAEACGVTTGILFITKDGTPLLHSAIWKEIKRVCREAGMEEDAGNPRNLYLLYLDTYAEACRSSTPENAFAMYQQLLCEEDALVAWSAEMGFDV